MSWASNPDSALSGGWLTSAYPGMGILGSDIPTAGDNGGSPVLNDGISAGKEYRWALVTPPASGTITLYEDLTFEFSGASDGIHSATYRLWEDGVDQGTATITLQVGQSYTTISVTLANIVGSVSSVPVPRTAISATLDNVTGAVSCYPSGSAFTQINAVLSDVLGNITSSSSGGFSGSLSDADIARIAAAVLAALNSTTGSRTLGQHLQIQTAVLAGETSGAGTPHIAFIDGSVTVEADVPAAGEEGDRQNVVVSGV
ncbi:MAG: hypothetical protein KUL87_14620 [Pseudomonas sp.]|nr:hypothetical protein [Pseudomonas sp.]